MTPNQFVAKWQRVTLSERSACQQHFLDLCAVLGQPTPAAADPTGEWYTFEKGVTKESGGRGFADVWKKDYFAWEYKGKHKNLDAAYVQLLQYREALDNPPLLIVSDMDRVVVHTNYTRFAKKQYEVRLGDLADPAKLALLRRAFTDPDSLRPDLTREQVTKEVAARLAGITDGMRRRGIDSYQAAKFLTKIVFCLFAEDIRLLKQHEFTRSVAEAAGDPVALSEMLDDLFTKMAKGGRYGNAKVEHFNGGLFDDGPSVLLEPDDLKALSEAATYDWGDVDLSIFGTLFERTVDPTKMGLVGSHYTDRTDVETLLRPVLLEPLEREWRLIQAEADRLWERVGVANGRSARTKAVNDFERHLDGFLERLSRATVLDPACGSGNFLYVALTLLLNLEKEVITYRAARTGQPVFPRVSPEQILGLEHNRFARHIASAVVWIGYLQWQHRNGYLEQSTRRPIIGRTDMVVEQDAVLNSDDPAAACEAEWPDAEFIVGNPPFVGGNRVRSRLGDAYVNSLFAVYRDRVPGFADYCCYWFEKARAAIAGRRSKRAGFVATQSIRGGVNRQVLSRIKQSGDVFFAVSDRKWYDEKAAAVHVSMVGFDGGHEAVRTLDGCPVRTIHATLSAGVDTTAAAVIPGNQRLHIEGVKKGAKFELDEATALAMLASPNPHGRPNSDVVRLYFNGADLTQQRDRGWVIYYPPGCELRDARLYDQPFHNVSRRVYPRYGSTRKRWWQHERARPEMTGRLV